MLVNADWQLTPMPARSIFRFLGAQIPSRHVFKADVIGSRRSLRVEPSPALKSSPVVHAVGTIPAMNSDEYDLAL